MAIVAMLLALDPSPPTSPSTGGEPGAVTVVPATRSHPQLHATPPPGGRATSDAAAPDAQWPQAATRPDASAPDRPADPPPPDRPGASGAPDTEPWRPDPPSYGVEVIDDVPITMRDGRVLRAAIHHPVDLATGGLARGPFPAVLWLTPYGKSAAGPASDGGARDAADFGGPSHHLVRRGYLGIAVDVAGTGGSEGASQLFGPVEAADSAEVIDWAASLPTADGTVGMSGISYLGIAQLFAAAEVGPDSPLRAIFPIAAAADPYRDLFVAGGIVNVESSLGLLAAYAGTRTLTPLLERGPHDPVDAARLALEHGLQAVPFELRIALDVLLEGERRFDGAWWQARAPEHALQRIVDNGVAVHLIGGTYDVFQRGTPLLYSGLQNAWAGRDVHAPMVPDQPVSPSIQLLYGPWHHGNQGAGVDVERLQLRWFDHWLKGRDTGVTDTTTPARFVEPDGTTYDLAAYPAEDGEVERLYLGDGALVSDPDDAAGEGTVVFTGLTNPCTRSTQQWSAGTIPAEMCGQRQYVPRPYPGEVAYATPPLQAPLRLAGPGTMTLQLTSTRPEVMLAVTVEDVAPDGTAVELSSGALLGSLRAVDPDRSWPSPVGDGWVLPRHTLTREVQVPVTPGDATRYDIEIRPLFATLPAGHRLRVTVGSGDLPHLLPPTTALSDLAGGIYLVHHTGASHLDLTVRPAH